MKSYALFEYDVSDFNFSIEKEISEPDKKLMKYCLQEITYIIKKVETFQQDDEDIFNSVYRHSKLISGLLRVNERHELHYLLEVLVFCTDFLRHNMQKKTVKKIPHEINYIINLIHSK